MKQRNSLLFGLAGSAGLFLLFFGVLSIANSFDHAVTQLAKDWPWVIALSMGFGLQVGLYAWVQNQLALKSIAGKEIAATGAVSGTTMLACCAHHVVDVVPFLGLAFAATILNQFQPVFIAIGLASNLVGITFLLWTAKRYNVLQNHVIFREILKQQAN